MKKILSIICALVFMMSAMPLWACTPRIPDDENTLEIFTVYAGYGYEWLEKEADEFIKQDWVKEKYPDLKVYIDTTVDAGLGKTKVVAGGKVNTADLVFTTQPAAGDYDKKDENGNYYFEELSSLLESKVPGEDRTVADKMNDEVLVEARASRFDGTQGYFGLPWVNGFMGLFVNKTYVSEYLGASYEMPATTDELVQMCKDIKSAGGVPQIPTSNYYHDMFPTWWAQYEGTEGYYRFWTGMNENEEYSAEIFKQEGRKQSLMVLESLLLRANGLLHAESTTASYTKAQTILLSGGAAMQANGDWLECEMRGSVSSQDIVTMIKTPVISAIVNREDITSVNNDEQLAFLVREIDKIDDDATYGYEQIKQAYDTEFSVELTQNDYSAIYEARNIMHRLNGHYAHVPSYAKAKEPAKDFLRFLATDKAIDIMMENTGAVSPYEYDIEEENPTLYASFSTMLKDHIKYAKTGIQLRSYASFPLNYYGGVLPLAVNSNISGKFMAQNSKDKSTAIEVFNQEYEKYAASGGAYFNVALRNAGFIK